MPGFRLLISCALASLLGITAGSASAAVTYTISGSVWFDANGNRLPSVWEPKQRGAVIKLVNPSTGNIIRTAVSNALGNYSIRNVPRGNYRLTLTPPRGFTGSREGPIVVRANTVRNFPVGKPRSLEEASLNAFGGRWSQAKNNPWLSLAPGPGCYRKPAPGTEPTFTQEELKFHQTLDADFYVEGCAVLLEHSPPFDNGEEFQTSDMLRDRVAQFKATHPDARYIGYHQPTSWEVGQAGWKEIIDNHKDWFVYRKDAPSQSEDYIVKSTSGYWLLDITNPAYQDFIAAKLAGALAHHGMDGLIFDSVLPQPRIPDLSVLPTHVAEGWQNGWASFLTKMKAAVGDSRFIFASIPRGEFDHGFKIIPLVDGILLEDTFSPVRNDINQRISRVQPLIDAAAARGKYILTTVNTKVDGSEFASTTPAKEHALARYYLAAYYIFQKGKMLFYHNPPALTTPQYGAQAFFTDWNIKVGRPVTKPGTQVPGSRLVYKRQYGNSIVYLNSHPFKDYVITVPRGSLFKYDPDGAPVTRYVLKSKTAFILSRAEAFQ